MKKKLRVLILEDSKDDSFILLRELSKSNYIIKHEIVEEAVGFEKALLNGWDIIIADYSLPNFTGFDALNMCNKKGIDIPFIIVSGVIGEDIAVDMMKLGARDYIMKNSFARLLPAITRELGYAKIKKERKQAENALKLSENLYHTIFDQANEGLVLMTHSGKLAQVNIAFAQMHGFTIDEMKKMNITDINVLGNRTFNDNPDILHQANQGEIVRYEVEHYHKDGHIIPISITISKINFGEIYYLAFYQDITERKKSAAAVQKKMDDLLNFNRMSVGRELKMVELKKEINALLNEMGKENRYDI